MRGKNSPTDQNLAEERSGTTDNFFEQPSPSSALPSRATIKKKRTLRDGQEYRTDPFLKTRIDGNLLSNLATKWDLLSNLAKKNKDLLSNRLHKTLVILVYLNSSRVLRNLSSFCALSTNKTH